MPRFGAMLIVREKMEGFAEAEIRLFSLEEGQVWIRLEILGCNCQRNLYHRSGRQAGPKREALFLVND